MTLHVCFWNINGLSNDKYEDEEFIETIQQYDIICLTETWKNNFGTHKNNKTPEGYREIQHNRKYKHKNAKRNSGGILILYRSTLHNSIKIGNQSDENIIWLKIDRKLLGTEGDLQLGTIYISPFNSSIYKAENRKNNTFEALYNQIASFEPNQPIIVGGDFNARTGNLKDIVINGKNENIYLQLPDYVYSKSCTRERVNQDKKINDFGYELRDICISANLNILNGRTIGDLMGKYSYIGPNGCSTVDYVLSSDNICNDRGIIKHFKVNELKRFSDHRPISLSLKTIPRKETVNLESTKIREESKIKVKSSFCHQKFVGKINSDEFKRNSKNILKFLQSEKGDINISTALRELDILMKNARNIPSVTNKNTRCINNSSSKKGNKKKPWYSMDCRALKRNLDYTCKAINKHPENTELRGTFYKLRREYKKILRKKKLDYERNLIQKLEESSQQGNDFWKKFQKINSTKDKETLPEPIDIQNYFSNLYNENLESDLIYELNNRNSRKGIDFEITLEEIKIHLNKLKNKKAAGEDEILNEMLKSSNDVLIEVYRKLFNIIIKTEKYPREWSTTLTKLIHKEGNRDDPSNFRGISLASNLSKLFNSILYARINDFLVKNSIIRPEQGGFRKDFRTTDHIFILQTIVEKYIRTGKRVYTCFVDLKKAFDSVWRQKTPL